MNTADQAAFLLTIGDNPADDTVRLAYADFLEELSPVRVKCPRCKGEKQVMGYTNNTTMLMNCDPCDGTGEVLGTANADRGEFIRLQCELARRFPDNKYVTGGNELSPLRERESALLAAHEAEWRKAGRCEKCDGHGTYTWPSEDGGSPPMRCPDCWKGDAGGLLRTFDYRIGNEGAALPEPVRVEFARGFPHRVTVPRLEDCVEYPSEGEVCAIGDGGPRPTPWAIAVCQHHPVMFITCLDQQPTRDEGGWEWYDLPDELNTMITKQTFSTPDDARTALGVEVVKFVRRNTA